MIEKQTKKETMSEMFKRNNAVISMEITNGFANFLFENDGKITVTFISEEGYGYNSDEMEIDIIDIQKVGKFMEDLKSLKLSEFTKTKNI